MDKTVSAYNNCASAYEEKFSKNETYNQHALSFASLFEAGSSILDIGCGPGLNSALFTGRGISVTGIDASSEMIRLAEKNCPAGNFINISADMYESQKKFDGLYLSFVIVHMDDDKVETLLDRLHFMIKTGGYVYISFMVGKTPGNELSSFAKDEIYYNYFNKDEIISRFHNNDFELISSHSDPYEEADGSFTDDIFLVFKKV